MFANDDVANGGDVTLLFLKQENNSRGCPAANAVKLPYFNPVVNVKNGIVDSGRFVGNITL